MSAAGPDLRIERVTELPTAALAPLVEESRAAGWRHLQRLCDDWRTGENRFDAPGEALYVGRRLAGRLLEEARGAFSAVRLRTFDPRAAAFYRALGFREHAGDAFTHELRFDAARADR